METGGRVSTAQLPWPERPVWAEGSDVVVGHFLIPSAVCTTKSGGEVEGTSSIADQNRQSRKTKR